LEQSGASVTVFRVDVADETGMRDVLAAFAAASGPLRGVVHAAGLPGRCAIGQLNLSSLQRMFAAKIAGSWNLHRLTSQMPLDFFVLFSSMVSLWGAKEQAHYAAANHFLDVLAHHRRALGLPASCVNWGPLSGGGMLPQGEIAELARIGISTTPMTLAPRILDRLLRSDRIQAAAVSIDWPKLRSFYQSRGHCHLFDRLVSDAPAAIHASAPQTATVVAQLRKAPESERREILLDHLRSTVVQVLGLDADHRPDSRRGFFEMGMDSLTATELKAKLQASLGISLPATLAFDHGTIDAMADFLLREELQLERPRLMLDAQQDEDHGSAAIELIARMSEEEAERLLELKLRSL
jgi:acyl carrier protein